MAYRCSQAIIGGAREPIRCKVSGSVCAHQKYCLMEGRIMLTDQSLWCPARGGRLIEQEPEKAPEAPVAAAADPTTEPAEETAPGGGAGEEVDTEKDGQQKEGMTDAGVGVDYPGSAAAGIYPVHDVRRGDQ